MKVIRYISYTCGEKFGKYNPPNDLEKVDNVTILDHSVDHAAGTISVEIEVQQKGETKRRKIVVPIVGGYYRFENRITFQNGQVGIEAII